MPAFAGMTDLFHEQPLEWQRPRGLDAGLRRHDEKRRAGMRTTTGTGCPPARAWRN